MLVHEMMEYEIEKHGLDHFTNISEGSPYVNVRREWADRVGADDSKPIIPIAIRGDSAGFLTRDSIYLMLWSALGIPDYTRHWFAVLVNVYVAIVDARVVTHLTQ